jgi:transcriptional regulator with XRE-family HTH domain
MTLEEKLANVPVEKDFFSELSEVDIAYEKLMGKISGKIILERTKNHLSQEDLAKKLGVKQSLISKWESGDNNFTFLQAIKIFSKLGIDVDIVFNPQNQYIQNSISSFRFTMPRKQKTILPSKEIRNMISEKFLKEESAIA